MKRKVLIYKDPMNEGAYINKTASWLNKAQSGIETGVTPVTEGMMQQMQKTNMPQATTETQAPTQEELKAQIISLANEGYRESDVNDYLLTNVFKIKKYSQDYYKIEPGLSSYVKSIFSELNSEEDYNNNEDVTPIETNETPVVEDLNVNANISNDIAMDSNEANNVEDISDDLLFNSRYGGAANKRKFINNYMQKFKKADGDEINNSGVPNLRGTEKNPLVAPGNKDSFINGVANQSKDFYLKKEAENEYNNLNTQNLNQAEDMDYAQFGGMRMRRANRKLFGSGAVPPGVTSSKYKFGFLGGLREADIQYNPLLLASMFPMMTYPGMSPFGASSQYNQSNKRISKGRLVTERIASVVNDESLKEVSTTTDKKDPTIDPVVVPGPIKKKKKKENDLDPDPIIPDPDPIIPEPDPIIPGPDTGVADWIKGNYRPYDPNVARAVNDKTLEENNREQFAKIEDLYGVTEYNNLPWYERMFTSYPGAITGLNPGNPNASFVDKYVVPGITGVANPSAAMSLFNQAPKLLNTGQKALNTGQQLLNNGKPLLNPGQQMLNPGQRLLNPPGGYQFKLPFAYGGATNDMMQDEFGNLQRFVYGGDEELEDLLQPPVNQYDLNYTNSKDSTDPYFQKGGMYRFDDGGQWITKSDGTTVFLKDDGTVDSGRKITEAEKTTYDASRRKDYDSYYDKNKDKYQNKYLEDFKKQQLEKQRLQGFTQQGFTQQGFMPQGNMQQGYGRGLLNTLGNRYSPYNRGREEFSAVNPLAYAATAAMITNSGMLPTGMKYSKERKQDGNFFERNLGFNKDRITSLSYATPDQIKAKAAAAQLTGKLNTSNPTSNTNVNTTSNTNPNTSTSTNTEGLKDKSRRAIKRGEDKMRGTYSDEIILDEDNPLLNTPVIDDKPIPIAPKREYTDAEMGIDPRTYDDLINEKRFPKPVVNMNPANKPADPNLAVGNPGVPVMGLPPKAYGGYAEDYLPDYMAYGGYIPDNYYADGGYLLEAVDGIDVSPVSFAGNPVTGLPSSPTFEAMDYFNNQNKDIKNPNVDTNKYYTKEPDDLADCTYEQKLDSTSKCYSPQSAELKIKTDKSGNMNYGNISNILMDTGANFADGKDFLDEQRTKYVPGMTEFSMGEKQSADKRLKQGEYNKRTGREPILGYKDVSKQGGSIGKYKKNGEYELSMQDIQELLKLGGLIEFLERD